MKIGRIHIIILLITLLVYGSGARAQDHATLPFNSLRLEFAGKTVGGLGFTFEHAWQKQSTKHVRAFNSVEATVGYMGYVFMVASIGGNRNWYLGQRKRWTFNCGLAVGARICPDPTSKEIREYYDSTGIYSGEYLTPLQPWFFGNISCRYRFRRMFVQASFVPVLFYEKASRAGWTYGPWGGVSVGLRFK
jgi:hypothetical protein